MLRASINDKKEKGKTNYDNSNCGKFSPVKVNADGKLKTYICAEPMRLEGTDALAEQLQENN